MSLSCGCDYDGDFEWYYYPGVFKTLDTKNARRCKACKTPIKVGVGAYEFPRYRTPQEGSIEERVYGDEVPMAYWYLCERCGDIYSSLTELGFCVDLTESMDAQLAEYYRDYAKPPAPGFALRLSSPKVDTCYAGGWNRA